MADSARRLRLAVIGGGWSGLAAAVRATRIERKPATDTWVRVAGVIQNLDTAASTFTLGGLTVHFGAGTTIFTGRAGQGCAATFVAAASRARARTWRRFMGGLLVGPPS